MDVLTDKIAVVTGAAGGLGRALATRFVAEGMRVVMSDVQPEGLRQAVDQVGAGGSGRVFGVVCDVADEADVIALREACFDHFGTAHLICNNAGRGGGGPISGAVDVAGWRATVDVDLFGIVHGVAAFLPRLRLQGEGHIVNTASRQGLVVTPGLGAYCPAKFAAVALSESLAAELGAEHSPVGVSVLCPGPVRTEMLERGVREALRDRPELARARLASAVTPEAVAGLVVKAVRARRLYAVTHRETLDWLSHRMQQIAADLDHLGALA